VPSREGRLRNCRRASSNVDAVGALVEIGEIQNLMEGSRGLTIAGWEASNFVMAVWN